MVEQVTRLDESSSLSPSAKQTYMKTITIDGVEYSLTPVKKETYKVLEQHLKFEVYPKDLGKFTWNDAKEACAALGEGWRLPTREELHLMWLNKDDSFASAYYWSSNESNDADAWLQNFNGGDHDDDYKTSTNYVRPVRDVKVDSISGYGGC